MLVRCYKTSQSIVSLNNWRCFCYRGQIKKHKNSNNEGRKQGDSDTWASYPCTTGQASWRAFPWPCVSTLWQHGLGNSEREFLQSVLWAKQSMYVSLLLFTYRSRWRHQKMYLFPMVCWCVSVCTHRCSLQCMADAQGSQTLMLSVFLYCSPLIFETGSLTELTILARLPGQQAPRIPSPPPRAGMTDAPTLHPAPIAKTSSPSNTSS